MRTPAHGRSFGKCIRKRSERIEPHPKACSLATFYIEYVDRSELDPPLTRWMRCGCAGCAAEILMTRPNRGVTVQWTFSVMYCWVGYRGYTFLKLVIYFRVEYRKHVMDPQQGGGPSASLGTPHRTRTHLQALLAWQSFQRR